MKDKDIEKKMKDLADIFGKKEELNPELAEYYHYTPSGIPIIQHPLVYSIFHSPEQNALVNKQLEYKKTAAAKALDANDWGRYIFLHERPCRLQAFQDIEHKLTDKEYWEELGQIWIDSENIWQNQKLWTDYLKSKRSDREYFMDEADREEFNRLPEELTIYRGYTKGKNENGYSYTLDKNKAEWFSSRFGGGKSVKTLKVKKKDCFAYLGGRSEKEIIYLGK
jgi:hypothetical protein